MPEIQSTRSLAYPIMKNLTVKLSTSTGCVFNEVASSINLHTQDGTIHINSNHESHMNMIRKTRITFQTAAGPCEFILENAAAGMRGSCFTVLAEQIRRVRPDRK
ncbi:MAG: hypothetical protein ABJN80_01155 [Luteolibacter sp.]